jgi:outer membrane protein assembly factor BamA
MKSYTLILASLIGLCLLRAQIVLAQATKPQEPASSSTQPNPFEAVPKSSQPPPPKVSGPTIEAIEFRGARRLPQSILRSLIASRVGGAYDLDTLRRDSQALYNTGRFSNIAWETELGPKGAIVRFVVVERPLIQSIEYQVGDTVTLPEILERFEQRKVKLRAETLYNDEELGRAAATLQELLVERGRQNFTVTPLPESLWPHSTVKITFRVDEKR